MIKKMLLIFLCLSLFLSIPYCKKTPTTPDIPSIILPSIEYFNASPESINRGESSTLSWSVTNATTITIDQGVGTVSAEGTTEVSPEETTTYTLTAENNDGTKTSSLTITVTYSEVVMVYNWIYYEGWAIYPKFSAWGTIKNVGTGTAYNIRIRLRFWNKEAWGGELYKEIEWQVSPRFIPDEEFDWRYDWYNDEAWDMCRYVDTRKFDYHITWD